MGFGTRQPKRRTRTMNAKHTPGPWTMGWEGAVREPGLGRPCVGTTGHADWVGPHGAEADARLLAAAPDLLAALTLAMDTLATPPEGDTYGALERRALAIVDAARAAIARATGGAK